MASIKKLPFIPETRAQALSILRSVGDDPSQLTESQRQGIRRLYGIGDHRTIKELVESGEVQP